MKKEPLKARLKRRWVNYKRSKEIERREAEIRRMVPYTCYTCELLGICRDERNGWKCRHGCMLLPDRPREEWKKKRK